MSKKRIVANRIPAKLLIETIAETLALGVRTRFLTFIRKELW